MRKAFTLRINEEIFNEIEKIADLEMRSVSNFIEYEMARIIKDWKVAHTHDGETIELPSSVFDTLHPDDLQP